ncbi:hypothetical protein [Solirhodobacter olei]|uniref:hypothetical protein n=1 Tax=Solirhodobacter olei TaxID=2493082 RepID=UPI000FDAD44D|nr:hypothetical protein [Solirhodobacter olei]
MWVLDRASGEEARVHVPQINSYQNEVCAFARHVRGVEPHNPVDVQSAILDLKVIRAIHDRLETRQPIQVW